MADVAPRLVVNELVGTKGDLTISNYVAAVLELGDFDLGRNGEGAYEAFGQMLVLPSLLSEIGLGSYSSDEVRGREASLWMSMALCM